MAAPRAWQAFSELRLRLRESNLEVLFAHLKRILELDRRRLRGMSGAREEFTLAAAVQNLRRMAKLAMASQMA